MYYVYFAGTLAVYMVLGGIFCGYLKAKDNDHWMEAPFSFFIFAGWPVFIAIYGLYKAICPFLSLGERLAEWQHLKELDRQSARLQKTIDAENKAKRLTKQLEQDRQQRVADLQAAEEELEEVLKSNKYLHTNKYL